MSDFEPLNPKGVNSLDYAIAAVGFDEFASGRPLQKVNKLKSGEPLSAAEQMAVMKVGRTTDYTEGEISDISVDVTVQYGIGNLSFQNQILIRGTETTPLFSGPGDSGSLIVHCTQSAIKIFVSCGSLPLRFEAHTSRLPSELNMGNASKSG